jgi:hypothetical protein
MLYLRVLLFCAGGLLVTAIESAMKVDRASVRISYVSQAERLTRNVFSTDAPDFSSRGGSKAIVDPSDILVAQVGCVSVKSGDVAHPQQAFLRFVREDTGADAIYVMKRKSIEMRAELTMTKEIRDDLKFWSPDARYRVEVIVGDTRFGAGVSWVAIEGMQFSRGNAGAFKTRAQSVFDFDVGVKRFLLPEFSSQLPPEEKQAPAAAILIALIALLLPLPLVVVAWLRLGVFPLKMPDSASERSTALLFEACLLMHAAALVMFWLQWNIVRTWKVMAAITPPTIFFGQKTLSAASRKSVSKATGKLGKDK